MAGSFGERIDEIHGQIEAQLAGERDVFYSAYPNDEDGLPINNLGDVAVSGKVQVIYKNYGGDGPDYVSDIIENPTWLQIALWTDEAIKQTNDFHHHFLEGIHSIREADGVNIISLRLGS